MMKIIIATLLTFTVLQAKEYKAVFDCSSSNASYIKSRMWLIGKTMDMIEKKGDKATFVLTLHGGCVPMVSKEYDMIVPDEDVKSIQKAQEYLKNLSQKRGVKVLACAMSLSSNAMEEKEVLPFVSIVPNSFIDTIGYQNDGYALMTFK
ncbi:MAG: DsrE family protein [Sulfurovum sp.]|nr:DsrE family protein [Sulfurovum sp.]